MKIIAKKDFTMNNKGYIEGDELTGITFEEIVKLNEQGFIQPLGFKDLVLIQRELEGKKSKKEEK